MRQPVAAIDVGTNTARLLIGIVEPPKGIVPVATKRFITRLGGGFSKEAGIADDAWKRSVRALEDFVREIGMHSVRKVRAVATSAVRDAVNGRLFCDDVAVKTGLDLEIIDGAMEGLLTLQGVLAGLDESPLNLFVFDIGGGSTEYTFTEGGEVLFTESLPLGVVRLIEGKIDIDAIGAKIERELAAFKGRVASFGALERMHGATLVGTAGTATTLAAISMKMASYEYAKVNNHVLSLQEIRRIYSMLVPMRAEERLKVAGIEQGREDLIIAGMMLTIRTMEVFGFSTLKVSEFGLLEGILLNV